MSELKSTVPLSEILNPDGKALFNSIIARAAARRERNRKKRQKQRERQRARRLERFSGIR